MNYNKGYMSASSLAGSIRESALSGTKIKIGSGLASRLAQSEQETENYDDVVPKYITL